MTLAKKGGYPGGKPAREMRPPTKVPSDSIRPKPKPDDEGNDE